MDVGPVFPTELRPLKHLVDAYVTAKIRQFASGLSSRLNLNWTPQQLEQVVAETIPVQQEPAATISNTRALRLVLRHDCQSTGCGENGCTLCQYNPSRLCKRNLKNKYLIDDHLRAKCGAPLRVELVDESGACESDGLPQGTQLEVHVLNGEKYKEICPDNTLLSNPHLRSCVISHHQKALLKREGGSDEQLRCFLQLEAGQGPLSDLQVTTSSEALLAGKAPTFRLLVWAVDVLGEVVGNVTYVVSENFVVATKRVKHAIKSDIPSVADGVSKLVHIGKATVDKLLDLRLAAKEEGFEIGVPDNLNRIDKVGQFRELVELSEMNSDIKNKVRHLLKLSPEKWEEVSQHALAAVVPDFRNRVWWCPSIRSGLLFACKNGSVAMEHPIALVKSAASQSDEDQVIPIHQLDPVLFHTIPKLKQQAVQSWYAASHPGWQVYWKDQNGDIAEMLGLTTQDPYVNGGGDDGSQQGGSLHLQLPPAPELVMPRPPAPSPFAAVAQPNGPPRLLPGSGPKIATSASPFAAGPLMGHISDAFPNWQQGMAQHQLATETRGLDHGGGPGAAGIGGAAVAAAAAAGMNPAAGMDFPAAGMSMSFPSLPQQFLKNDSHGAPWNFDPNKSSDWLTSGTIQAVLQMQQQQQGLASQAGLLGSQQGVESYVAEMEARTAAGGGSSLGASLGSSGGGLGGVGMRGVTDRSDSINRGLSGLGSIDLDKVMGLADAGGSWRMPPSGFSDSPALPKNDPPTDAQQQQQQQQGAEETENSAKRARIDAGDAA